MSLIKQLWIGMILLLLLALGGSFVVSLSSAREYLQNQLTIKNIDDANSLALSLSQMEKDAIDIELIITAQFDAGHYEYIMFNDQHKKPVAVRRFEDSKPDIPKWFVDWVKIDAAPGIALIQDGWQQYGNIIVKSHSSYAIESLWKQAKHLFEWFLLSCLIATLVGIFVFRLISTGLHRLIDQAEAISNRRFISSPESRITEFRRLTQAMNRLSASVKSMLEKETSQLDLLRRDSLLDPLTQLNNRQHFLSLLDNLLSREDSDNQGVIILCRVLRLGELNGIYGYEKVDEILKEIAQAFFYVSQQHPNSHTGRLNGSDFAIAIPTMESFDAIAADLVQRLNFQLIAHDHQSIATPMAVVEYQRGENRHSLLHSLDGALAQAELKGDRSVIACLKNKVSDHKNLNDWRQELELALENNRMTLANFPVRNLKGELLHMESPVRMGFGEEKKPAGYFIPWASRLNLLAAIDLAVVKLALNNLENSLTPLAIHLSSDVLCNAQFREKFLSSLKKSRDRTHDLWIEFSEVTILRHPNEFRSMVKELRELGCKVGLEHAGLEFTRFEQLQDLGMHYLKIDSAIIRDIDTNPSNQTFVQSLCKLGHSLGITMIAEGVRSENEKSTLTKIGVDGFTGPLIQ
jgi:EAL domain-containing protein (putative c-di-GMP-specific phosphodiesterase class I)/GGDEF domain-containing protein